MQEFNCQYDALIRTAYVCHLVATCTAPKALQGAPYICPTLNWAHKVLSGANEVRAGPPRAVSGRALGGINAAAGPSKL